MDIARTSIPRWLIVSTTAFTLLILAMAVAETNLWMHFLVDRGEYISVAGALFIGAVGIHLHRQKRLKPSLPLFVPWLLYPVLTQGDQLIDNLTINQMRLVCHVILAVIFGAPILVIALAIHNFVTKLTPRGVTAIVGIGFALDIWVAYEFLGWYMILTLVGMAIAYAVYALFFYRSSSAHLSETMAFRIMLVSVAVSLALFYGFKNRPGAYQGSPAAFMDPTQKDAIYDLSRVPAPSTSDASVAPAIAAETGGVLAQYGDALRGIVHAYWLMDRNYNYSFHNELFWRATPIVPDFRAKALDEIARMREVAVAADERAAKLEAVIPAGSPMGAFLREIQEYTAYNLRRAPVLERMSAEFIRTTAGLQHATHLYEGEAKMVDVELQSILDKHRATLNGPPTASVDAEFMSASRKVHEMYGNRIVGF